MLFYHRAHAGRRRRPAGTCPVGGLPSGKLGFWAKFPAYRSMSEPSSPRPDLRARFLGFAAVGLSGFGGVLPFARRMLVEQRRWMTGEEFNAQLGLCQFLPGPNVINLAVAVGVGLLFAMAWRMGLAIRDKAAFLPFTVAVVAAIAWLRWPMPGVMLGGLLLSGGLAYWKLGRK